MNRTFPRVLVVDDAVTECYLIFKIFEMWKWDARRAHTCERALAVFGTGDVYDLLILDLLMPDCDGIEILRWARQNSPNTRVIITTQKGVDDVAEVGALKPDMLLHKPYFFEPVRAFAEDMFTHFFEERAARRQATSSAAPPPAAFAAPVSPFQRTIP